jgi:hypothetical protein
VERKNHSSAVGALSFATSAQKWSPVEHDAGHFLFALEQTKTRGLAVIEPPNDKRHLNARDSHRRVRRWFESAKVPGS